MKVRKMMRYYIQERKRSTIRKKTLVATDEDHLLEENFRKDEEILETILAAIQTTNMMIENMIELKSIITTEAINKDMKTSELLMTVILNWIAFSMLQIMMHIF